MGCPDNNVNGQGSGAYMIKVPELAKEIAEEIKKTIDLEFQKITEGNPRLFQEKIPLSIKTRIGYNMIEWQTWLGKILKVKPQVISIHLRTKKEMSLVPAHWELAPEIVLWIRENFGTPENGGPIIIFNGDVKDCVDARIKWEQSGCDGIMIGRGIFGNPWLFNRNVKKENLSIKEILMTLIEHTKMFEKEMSFKNFNIMKKHFKAYINGFPNAKELRVKCMEVKNAAELERIIKRWLFWSRAKKVLYFWR